MAYGVTKYLLNGVRVRTIGDNYLVYVKQKIHCQACSKGLWAANHKLTFSRFIGNLELSCIEIKPNEYNAYCLKCRDLYELVPLAFPS